MSCSVSRYVLRKLILVVKCLDVVYITLHLSQNMCLKHTEKDPNLHIINMSKHQILKQLRTCFKIISIQLIY